MTADFWLGVAVGAGGVVLLSAIGIAVLLVVTRAPYNRDDPQ